VERVNLFSDTQTRPTEGMRRAIAEAEVGDEQRFADPTTTRLPERVADLLGHEAALFLPSGTMCNQIAIRLHTRPGGDELIAAANSHPVNYEAGGPAQFGGAMLRHHVERLAEDHQNARALAAGLAELPGFDVQPPDTNIVIAEVADAPQLVGELWDRGIEVTPMAPTRIRCVTHLDVDADGIERALAAFREVAG